MLSYQQTPVQEIFDPLLEKAGVRLLIKREELNHPLVTGNKWWKLKCNLEEATRTKKKVLLTFGGPYSNHIYAVAAAAKECGFESVGIIRGDEERALNATLSFAKECGMHLHFISREDYRKKADSTFIQTLHKLFGDFYLIPEGGSNTLAIKGVVEFSNKLSGIDFDYLCVPVGTGGTLAGLVAGLKPEKNIIGFSALKGGTFLEKEVSVMLQSTENPPIHRNWRIDTDFHFGGYGKVTEELLQFLYAFEQRHGFRLDPIYTGKMMYGIFKRIEEGMFPHGSTVVAFHTGGLQGWNGIQ